MHSEKGQKKFQPYTKITNNVFKQFINNLADMATPRNQNFGTISANFAI